jgi:hypothetical protein
MATTYTSILNGWGGKEQILMDGSNVRIYDLWQVAGAAFTATEITGGGQVQLDQSFDLVNWAAVQTLNVLGETKVFDKLSVIGFIRATHSAGTSVLLTVVGESMPVNR